MAGYLEELEGYPASSDTGETNTTQGPGSSGAPDASDGSGETTHDPDTTTTGPADTSTSSETTGDSSGEPIAACGNGMLEVSGPVPEECDDGNLDSEDGCSDTCALDRRGTGATQEARCDQYGTGRRPFQPGPALPGLDQQRYILPARVGLNAVPVDSPDCHDWEGTQAWLRFIAVSCNKNDLHLYCLEI